MRSGRHCWSARLDTPRLADAPDAAARSIRYLAARRMYLRLAAEL